MQLEYKIVNVRTISRKPGIIYASIVDAQGQLCVNATLDYCVGWIKCELAKAEVVEAVNKIRDLSLP